MSDGGQPMSWEVWGAWMPCTCGYCPGVLKLRWVLSQEGRDQGSGGGAQRNTAGERVEGVVGSWHRPQGADFSFCKLKS